MIAADKFIEIGKDPQCISKLVKFSKDYDWSGLEFPVSTKDIGLFEINNGVSINILSVEGREIYVHRKSCQTGRKIHLLLISEDEINHYTAIKSLSRLLSSSNSKNAQNNISVLTACRDL